MPSSILILLLKWSMQPILTQQLSEDTAVYQLHNEEFEALLVGFVEMCQMFRVHVEHSDNPTFLHDRHDDLGAGFAAARDMPRELFDILNNDGLVALPRSSTDAFAACDRNTGYGSLEGAEVEVIALNVVESDPPPVELLFEGSHDIGVVRYLLEFDIN